MCFQIFALLVLVFGCVCAGPVVETDQGKSVEPQDKNDLKADASNSYYNSYSNLDSPGYGGVTGYGLLGSSGSGFGYDNSYYNGNNGRYNGYNGYSGYNGYPGSSNGFRYDGYGGNGGYGGYGGYGGNGGLNSYNGYNNPYYQGNNHLGFGYYNKRPGYGNIYNNGITPSLVTGYRGYSRR